MIVTSDNWNDPVLNWWRDYFGTNGFNMMTDDDSEPPWVMLDTELEGIGFFLSWVRSPFLVSIPDEDEVDSDKRVEHPALVGWECDYTWVLIPQNADRPCSLPGQKQWLLWGWYKDRGCTEVVLKVDFTAPTGPRLSRVTYEELRQLANRWLRPGFVLGDPEPMPWKERSRDFWVPSPEDIRKLWAKLTDHLRGEEPHASASDEN